MPEPATRSLTVLETSVSPGAAAAPILAATCTARPDRVVADPLALAGVDTDPQLKLKWASDLVQLLGAADRDRGARERAHRAVSGGGDRDFPLGLGWVEKLPPYNEHLVGDVGGFYLAFALLFAWAAISLRRALVVPLCTAWSLAALLHFGYHVTHLGGFDIGDAVAETAELGLLLVLPAVAVAALSRHLPSMPDTEPGHAG
jgi:hypothetical protein